MKLSLAQNSIGKIVKKTEAKGPQIPAAKIRRWKYVLQWSGLQTMILDLEQRQRRFDPSWFLIMRVASPVIDQELATQKQERQNDKKSRTESQGSPTPTQQSPIALATNAAQRKLGGPWFIVERYQCKVGRNLSAQNNDVRTLARKLASADPWTFGLLSCKGVVRALDVQKQQIQAFDFIFRMPESVETPQSLRQNLLNEEVQYSVSKRVLIAKDLAKSVGCVHNLNFVHKHICPETILLFEDVKSRFSTFLVGFDNFRSAEGGTSFSGDIMWERNLYRHPSRQGEFPEEAYGMQHDIYTLGVCLLEIGLWQSFVSYSSDQNPRPQYGEAHRKFMKWVESNEAITSPLESKSATNNVVAALKLKEYFIHLAKAQLPITIGDKYSAVVVTCLTCLDEDNEDFGDEDQMDDNEGILVAVRFIKAVLLKLNEINI